MRVYIVCPSPKMCFFVVVEEQVAVAVLFLDPTVNRERYRPQPEVEVGDVDSVWHRHEVRSHR
jgi:hypothetical protein